VGLEKQKLAFPVSISLRFVLRTHHEVEASHQEDHVDKQKPMPAKGNLALRDECLCYVIASFAHSLTFNISVCFRETESEGNDQNRRTGAEPKKLGNSQFCIQETRSM